MAPSLLSRPDVKPDASLTPEYVRHAIEEHFLARQAELHPSGEQTKDGRRFSWCGDLFDFFVEGLAERLAASGITFSQSFPGPFRLLDEEQAANGDHVRRFWTTVLSHGCPIARLCTYFFHRHDRVPLPQLPKVVAYPPDHLAPETEP
ncbi:MAG: hypothetical protein FJ247_02860 [Nitrospira sp.]|nr:hypothetical protein [Nitrospira sp.]